MKKTVLLALVLWLLSTSLSLCVVGLLELQIAYASPYTSIDVDTAYNMITNGSYPDLVVLDVRTKGEYDTEGHIYGAVWIPVSELEARIGELAGHGNHEIIVYCRSGGRSLTACGILENHGFTKVYNMLGGITAWKSAGYPVWFATVRNVNTTFNYDTIQAAIDVPQTLDGHTIIVDAGTYYEHVVVNKSVSLIGEDKGNTIIDGSGTGNVIYVTANNTFIEDFTIQNGLLGVWFDHSHDNTFTVNNVWLCDSRAVYITHSSNNNLTSITASNINWTAIWIYNSSDNIVSRSDVIKNEYGIRLSGGSNNTIHGNNIANNDYGIYIYESSNNTIYHNQFTNNVNQTYVYESYDNIWDNGYPSGGNYWSNYNGTDFCSGIYQNITGSDGIGDIPYKIDEDNRDSYPLMKFGDVNGDGKVNVLDLLSLKIAIEKGKTVEDFPSCDINRDGEVNVLDLLALKIVLNEA